MKKPPLSLMGEKGLDSGGRKVRLPPQEGQGRDLLRQFHAEYGLWGADLIHRSPVRSPQSLNCNGLRLYIWADQLQLVTHGEFVV